MGVQTYRDLIVWQKSMGLVVEIYRVTNEFPRSEIYGLVSQMRRASVSIPSNIAEGFHRKSWKDRKQFFNIAYSSGAELETQLSLAQDVLPPIPYNTEHMKSMLDEVMRMLNKMVDSC